MKNPKLLFIVGLMIAMIFSSSLNFAQTERENQKKDFMSDSFFKELNLSETQKKQIKELHLTYHDSFKKEKELLKEAKEKFEEAMERNSSDQEIKSRFQELQKARVDFMNLRFEHGLAIRKILTPEQRKQFREMRKNMLDKKDCNRTHETQMSSL